MAQVDRFRVNVGDSIASAINAAASANGGIVYIVPGEHVISSTMDLAYPWPPPLLLPRATGSTTR